MSIRNILANTTGFRSLSNRTVPPVPSQANITAGFVPPTSSWFRNPSWLPLPTVTDSEQRFVGLHAVYPNANFVALTVAGSYTVDWGDGTTQNFNSGIQANYEYSFSDVDLNNTNAPVTFQDTGDTVTRNNHGYTNGMTLSFSSITTTTGIVAGQIYFVVGATTNTFQVAATSGGSALPLTNDGTGIILPYKQVIVTVTPQAGQNITSFNLNVRNNSAGAPGAQYDSGWLDYALSFPNCTTLTLNASTALFNKVERVNLVNVTSVTNLGNLFLDYRKLSNVVQINLRTTGSVNMAGSFNGCASLQTVPLFNTANVTDMSNMFRGCISLQTVPLFNTASVTNMSTMFQSCVSLQTVPLFNTALVQNMSSMFDSCSILQAVPLFNTVSVTNMSTMFQSCVSLQTVPLFNTALVTQIAGMFNSCSSLQTVPLFNTASVTNISSMFNSCRALISVPRFNMANVTTTTNMFGSCVSLQSVPLFNTAGITNLNSMFQGCNSLQTVPLFNTASATNMSGMFSSCIALKTVPLFNTASATRMDSMFSGCSSLQTVPLFNTASLTDIGSMFAGCSSLQTVPLLNTALVTSISAMFAGCSSLQTVPLFNTASVTGMSNMFQNCTSLVTVPQFSTFLVTNMGSMFQNCSTLQTVPALNVNAVTSSGNLTNIFGGCISLSQIDMTNIRFTFSVINCKLSATALNEIYTNLPTVTTQTITVTGNYGTATDDPTIATAKGWTVTG